MAFTEPVHSFGGGLKTDVAASLMSDKGIRNHMLISDIHIVFLVINMESLVYDL